MPITTVWLLTGSAWPNGLATNHQLFFTYDARKLEPVRHAIKELNLVHGRRPATPDATAYVLSGSTAR